MLTSARDYRILDMTGLEGYVTGRILPARQGGARRAMRFEDLLFVQEGKLERQHWRALPTDPRTGERVRIAPYGTRRFERYQLETVCHMEAAGFDGYMAADAELPDEIVSAAEFNASFSAATSAGVTLERVSVRRGMDTGPLEAAYRNLERLKRTYDTGRQMTDFFSASTVERRWRKRWYESGGWQTQSGTETLSGNDFDTLYRYEANMMADGGYDISEYVFTRTGKTFKGYPFAKSATWYAYVTSEFMSSSDGTIPHEGTVGSHVHPIELEMDGNGGMTLPEGAAESMVAATLEIYGMQRNSPPPAGTHIAHEIVAGAGPITVEHEFPASWPEQG